MYQQWKEHLYWKATTWVPALPVPLTSCETLGKTHNLSAPQLAQKARKDPLLLGASVTVICQA